MRFRNGATIVIAVLVAGCGATEPVASPPDPPQALVDAYSPFSDPLRSNLLWAGLQIQREFGGTAKCTDIRILSIPTSVGSGVGKHYMKAFPPGWQRVALTAPSAMTITAFRRDSHVFAAAVSRDAQDGIAGLVIVTNTVWDKDSAEDRRRCLAR